MNQQKFSWRRRAKSFTYAFTGMRNLIVSEHNARIHAAFAVAVIVAGALLGLSPIEWCLVVGCIGVVFASEAINSAIEAVVDLVSPNQHPLAGKAKDFAAAAVLFCAIASAIIGLVIFIPKLWTCCSKWFQ